MSENVKALIRLAFDRIVKRKPGHSRLVYDRATRTIRVKGQYGEDKGDSGMGLHE